MKLSIVLLLFCISSCGYAQELSMKSGFWKTKFYQGDIEIDKHAMEELLIPYPKAHSHWKKANTADVLSFLPSIVGGYYVGRVIGAEIFNGSRSNSNDIIFGLSGLAVGGLFSAISNTQRRAALSIYNESFDHGMHITPSASGVGFVVHF